MMTGFPELPNDADLGLGSPPTIVNDSHRVYSVAACCIALGILGTVAVALRLGTRFRLGMARAEDYMIFLATIVYVGWTTLAAYVNLRAGVGKPLWEVTVAEFTIGYKGLLGYLWMYPVLSALIRASIIISYSRFFGTAAAGSGTGVATAAAANIIGVAAASDRATRRQRRAAHYYRLVLRILLMLQGIYAVVFLALPITVCRPLALFWSFPLEEGGAGHYCDGRRYARLQMALHTTSFVFDAVLLVFPMYPVYRLPMTVRQRAGVAILFVLGAAASIVAAYKFGYFVHLFGGYGKPQTSPWNRYAMSHFVPAQYASYGTTVWLPSQLEPTVALLGTSLPALRQMLLGKETRLSDPCLAQTETRRDRRLPQSSSPSPSSPSSSLSSSSTMMSGSQESKPGRAGTNVEFYALNAI